MNDNDDAKCEDVPQTSSQGEEKQDQRRSAPQTRRPSWFCDRTSSPFLDLFFPGRLFHVADDLVFFTKTSLSQSIVSCHWKHGYWLFCLSREVNFDNKIHNSSCDWWSPQKRLFICVSVLGKSGIWHQEGYICTKLQNSCCGYWSPQAAPCLSSLLLSVLTWALLYRTKLHPGEINTYDHFFFYVK